jgi:hypothetical protein
MTQWKSSFGGVLPDFDLVFDRFEVLAALSYFERFSKDEIKVELANPAGFKWMPVGRLWVRRTLQIIETELAGERSRALLEPGFSANDRERLALFIQNLRRIAGKMSW